jgi:hypothetical protein
MFEGLVVIFNELHRLMCLSPLLKDFLKIWIKTLPKVP